MNDHLTTVLLDLDGTLLDSNRAHAKAWQMALAEIDLHRELTDIQKLIGMGSDHLLPKLISVDRDDEIVETLSKRRGDIFRDQFLETLKPFPKARELVERILEVGLTPVVATSASKADLEGLLKQIGIDDIIDLKTTSDDAARSKPSPDILEVALEKAKATPAQAIMIGDTPYDIKAATKAGLRTIAVTCGGWSRADLSEAIEVYNDPADLLAHFEKSPLGRR